MPSAVFADAAYYVAVVNDRDQLHERALAFIAAHRERPIVTTDSVLVELLAYFSNRGAHLKELAVKTVDLVLSSEQVTLVYQDRTLFLAGLDVYRTRLDKGYSLTDCMSMVVCKEQQIEDVLTHDRHFEQEGFAILL